MQERESIAGIDIDANGRKLFAEVVFNQTSYDDRMLRCAGRSEETPRHEQSEQCTATWISQPQEAEQDTTSHSEIVRHPDRYH